MIRQCTIIFGCLAVGELIVWLTGISIPSSIIGMLLLTALLQMKVLKLEWVKGMSDFLIATWASSSYHQALHLCSISTS